MTKPERKKKACTNPKCPHDGKPLDLLNGFTKDVRTKDGRSSWCRICQRIKQSGHKDKEKLNPMSSAEMKEAVQDIGSTIKSNQKIKREILYGL